MNKNILYTISCLIIGSFILAGCSGSEYDTATGWKLNDPEWGGYKKVDYEGQKTGPNLVLIPGGTFLMGQVQEDVMFRWTNIPQRQTVTSFYMDETEVTNYNYRLYTLWTRKTFGDIYPQVWLDALPDTLVWREELSFNEPMVNNYFRHPSYNNYPVVGVSWKQAKKYCEWRSDRVNEAILIKKGILNPNPEQHGANNFNTEAYLAGQYQGDVRKNVEEVSSGGERRVRRSDGILLPDYRLPTEAQWEYAALALIGNMKNPQNELISARRIYPWDGSTLRYQRRDKHQGDFLANFKRGAGDYMGIAGNLNDDATFTAPVKSFYPNDFGLYNMAGNVSEWTADVFRPLTSTTLRDVEQNDANPFRGNIFKRVVRGDDGKPIEKDSLGRLVKVIPDSIDRYNYGRADVRNYLDGQQEYIKYAYGETTLINNTSRVIKGGSWADRAYWLSPGARRYMQQDRASKTVGFRCAMLRVGATSGNSHKSGNYFDPGKRATSGNH